MKGTQVLIVDDDVVWRDVLLDALSDLGDINVVGTAPNGKIGLAKARQMEPDLLLVASGITDVSALDLTRTAMSERPELGVLLASSGNRSSADATIRALEAGAFDFVLKPDDLSVDLRTEALRRSLVPKIRCFAIRRYSRVAKGLFPDVDPLPGGETAGRAAEPREPEGPIAKLTARRERLNEVLGNGRIEAVLIGASTGGPQALSQLIPAFPPSFAPPIVIVLHMPKAFTGSMAEDLDRKSGLRVKEAVDGDLVESGTVYLAPGGRHLTVERGTRDRVSLRTTDGPPENACKPSVDVLLRSAADVFRGRALTLILTGMGEDGTRGLSALKQFNAPALVQDEASSVIWGMPGSVVRAGYANEVLPLDKIADRVIGMVGSS